MSVNPQQAWITPATALFGAAGGATGAIEFSGGGINNTLGIDTTGFWGQPVLANVSTGTLASGSIYAPFQVSRLTSFFYDGSNATSQKSATLYADSIIFQGSNGAGNQTTFLATNDVGLGNPQNAFALNGISTITTTSTCSWYMGGGFNNLLLGGDNGGVRILPNQNQINAQNLVFTSTISPLAASGTGTEGTINMVELTSSIKGYGWATVLPGVP